ncbi:MAG: lipopolysaccharide biosynthesis protein [Halioglobus sp.]
MRIGRNLLAGLSNSIWTAVVTFATVPLYLKYLGVEAYGLIGFFATTNALLQLLDLGLAPTINREIARHSATNDMRGAATTLHTLAIFYWLIALALAILSITLASSISEHWLGNSTLSSETTTQAVLCTGLIIACRWPVGIYRGALLGAQHLTIASAINMLMITLSSFGAVAILAWVSATIEAFFFWQLGVSVCYVVVIRMATWRAIGFRQFASFSSATLSRIWRFSAGMAGVAATGVLLAQLDKVLLSNLLSLEQFAHYTLAGLLASGLYILLTPTFNVVYPKFSVYVVNNKIAILTQFYREGTRILCAILFPVAITAACFAQDLVYVWTANFEVTRAVTPIVQLALLGTALNGAMHFPYALQLAFGASHLPLLINIALISLFIPLVFYLVGTYGAVGGAMAWLMVNGIYLIIGSWITHRSFLKGLGFRWLWIDVGVPLATTSIVVLMSNQLILRLQLQPLQNLVLAGAVAVLAFGCTAALVLRPTIKRFASGQFRGN